MPVYREAEGESPSGEEMKGLMNGIRDQLLQGLSDDSETIRYGYTMQN